MANIQNKKDTKESKVNYFHFPEKEPRQIIKIDGISAYDYISPGRLDRAIKDFSNRIQLTDFDVLCVNQKGGNYFANKIIKLQNYNGKIINIEYHEDKNIPIPIPKDILNLKIAILDDVLDKFITGGMIQKDAPNAQLFYMAKKQGVTSLQSLHNCSWALETDDVWLLGAGMNGESKGDGYPEDWGRNYEGIAVKIQ